MNNLVMYDRETNSLWSQFFGEAVEGRLAGTKLPLVASQILPWGDWKAQHPDTLFLDTGLDRLIIDSYMSYYFSDQTGVVGETNTDDRLRPKDLVVGILGESTQRRIHTGTSTPHPSSTTPSTVAIWWCRWTPGILWSRYLKGPSTARR